jgi:hypothetical protein
MGALQLMSALPEAVAPSAAASYVLAACVHGCGSDKDTVGCELAAAAPPVQLGAIHCASHA